jgi:hypothetical protein
VAPGAPPAWLCLAGTDGHPPARSPDLPADHEYVAEPSGDALVLQAASPRALLAGVYALLEAAGCRWSPFGATDEHVPEGHAARRVPRLAARPAFARRAYAADLQTWHVTMPERLADRLPHDVAFVDWMAKSGATGFQFIRHANDTDWIVPEVGAELVRRGLEVEGGGHALVELLPRGLFARHPDYFPLGPDRQRSDLGNACVSSREALALIAERARAARARIPGDSAFHLWGLDLLGGGWCACAGCERLTPSDQALRVCNATAEVGGGRIFHLAYHDTLDPPRSERPHPRVWAEFAPRERCYAHALDERCTTNARYLRALVDHLAWFDGRVEVFEYYGDAILFGGCAVPLARVIARDLACYARLGVPGVSCLTFGRYSLWAYGVNVEAFARGVHDPRAAEGATAAHCARRYAAAAATMERYMARLEHAMATVVTHGDVLLPPRDRDRAALAAVGRAAEELHALITTATGDPPTDERVAAQARLLDYTLYVLGALDAWLGGESVRALEDLSCAPQLLHGLGTDVIGTWGAYDLELTHHFFAAALRARS